MFRIIFLLSILSSLQAAEFSQTYFIKGMSCGGCVKSLKSSLDKNPNLNLLDSNIEVGSATLKFKNNQKDINCKVVHAIEGTTEYKVFLDKEYLIPACPKS